MTLKIEGSDTAVTAELSLEMNDLILYPSNIRRSGHRIEIECYEPKSMLGILSRIFPRPHKRFLKFDSAEGWHVSLDSARDEFIVLQEVVYSSEFQRLSLDGYGGTVDFDAVTGSFELV